MIQEEVTRSMSNATKEAAKKTIEVADNISKLLLTALLQLVQKDKENKILNKEGEVALKGMLKAVEKGEKLVNFIAPDEELAQLKPFLKKEGVLFAVTDLQKDDGKMILFLERSAEKMENALTLFKASKGLISEINPELFMKYADKENIEVAKLDKVELELFRYHAKATGLVFGAVVSKDTVNLLFKAEEKAKVENVLNKVSWDLTGEYGPRVRQQIEYRLQGRQECNIAIEQAKKEAYIVNSTNPKNYIKVTAQDFAYYKNNKEITRMNRHDPDFQNAVYTKLEGLVEPVLLTKEEFEKTEKERQAIIDGKRNIYPTGYSAVTPEMFKDAERDDPVHFKDSRVYSENFVITNVGHGSKLDALIAKAEGMRNAREASKETSKTKSVER